MRKWYIVIGTAVVLLGIAALAWMFVPSLADVFRSTTKITDTAAINKTVFGFVGAPYLDDYSNTRLPGYMDNISNKTVAKVNLEIQLFDSKGDRKELVSYSISDIAPGTRRTFVANAGQLDGPRTSKIRVVSVQVAK